MKRTIGVFLILLTVFSFTSLNAQSREPMLQYIYKTFDIDRQVIDQENSDLVENVLEKIAGQSLFNSTPRRDEFEETQGVLPEDYKLDYFSQTKINRPNPDTVHGPWYETRDQDYDLYYLENKINF